MDDKDKYLYLDTKLLAREVGRFRIKPNKKGEKEKEETMNKDKFKDSYFVHNGLRHPVEVINEHWEVSPCRTIHTLDISVDLNIAIDDVASLYPKTGFMEYVKADVENTLELMKKTKPISQIVDEVLAGKWGNGVDRKKALTDAGYDYNEVQKTVNSRMRQPKIKNVIFNDPATIVFWTDGTKTVVKAQKNDIFDPEKGLAMALAKKFLGNQGNYYEEFKKWLPEEKVESEQPMGKVIETIDNEDGFTIRFRPNEALKKAFEKLKDVKFNVPSSMELVKGGCVEAESCADDRSEIVKIRNSMRKRPRGK